MDTKPKTEQVAWLPEKSQEQHFLGLMKAHESLGAKIAQVFTECVEDAIETCGLEVERAVAVVKRQLGAIAVQAGYAESTVDRVLSTASGAYKVAVGLQKANTMKARGPKGFTIPNASYAAVVALYDTAAGRGTVPGPKFLKGCSQLLAKCAKDEEAIKELRAKVASAKPEAGKVVPISAPVRKAA